MSTTTSDIAAGDGEPFGYFVEHILAEPAFLRPPSYIPNGENYKVTPLFTCPSRAWQPIASAPKDGWGVPILTCRMGTPADWFGRETVGGYAEPPEAAYWNEHGDCWTPCQRPHDVWEPTHWMPLPSAPSQIEEG